jgi:hypothetical protein
MRKSLLTLTMTALMMLAFSSCSGLRQVSDVQSTSFAPTCVRVEANINDYTQLGETVVTVESRVYLGFINKIDKVNGEDYNFRDVKVVELEGKNNIKLNGDIKKAVYKVVEEYPGADYYVPVMKTTEVERMFLGKYVKKSVTVKAYVLKSN